MLFHRELADNLNVCTNCGHHLAISPRDRFRALFDGGVFVEVQVPKPLADPLGFRDQKKYPDRLREARKKTGEEEAMLVAEGEIGRTLKVICVGQDFAFMGGSMGMHVGNAIIAGAERAVKRKCPLVLFAAAGGARMQEGILSLMQMPRTTVAVEMLKEAGLPYIVVLTHPTTGGVTASYAMLGDMQIAEPNALICFAGAAGDRADDPRDPARGLPARRVPARPRHARPGGAAQGACGRADRHPADADCACRHGARRPAGAEAADAKVGDAMAALPRPDAKAGGPAVARRRSDRRSLASPGRTSS